MFPKKQRISKGTFEKSTAKGRRTSSEHLTVTKTPLETGVLSRFAVVVSKKVATTAVGRNLLRRRIFSALAEILKKDTGYSYVFFTKKGAPQQTYASLKKELESIIE